MILEEKELIKFLKLKDKPMDRTWMGKDTIYDIMCFKLKRMGYRLVNVEFKKKEKTQLYTIEEI